LGAALHPGVGGARCKGKEQVSGDSELTCAALAAAQYYSVPRFELDGSTKQYSDGGLVYSSPYNFTVKDGERVLMCGNTGTYEFVTVQAGPWGLMETQGPASSQHEHFILQHSDGGFLGHVNFRTEGEYLAVPIFCAMLEGVIMEQGIFGTFSYSMMCKCSTVTNDGQLLDLQTLLEEIGSNISQLDGRSIVTLPDMWYQTMQQYLTAEQKKLVQDEFSRYLDGGSAFPTFMIQAAMACGNHDANFASFNYSFVSKFFNRSIASANFPVYVDNGATFPRTTFPVPLGATAFRNHFSADDKRVNLIRAVSSPDGGLDIYVDLHKIPEDEAEIENVLFPVDVDAVMKKE
jgi:hypothetical protein